jgi:hypothetical protein
MTLPETTLRRDRQKVLDILDRKFNLLQESERVIQIQTRDLDRAAISFSDFEEILRSFTEPLGIKIEYLYDEVNEERPVEPQELGVAFHTLGKLSVSSDFKALLEKAQEANGPRIAFKLADVEVRYDPETFTIFVGDMIIELPKDKNEAGLCKLLFEKPKRVPIEWNDVATKILGVSFESFDKKKHQKSVQDTMYRTNDRVKALGTEDNLFSWGDRTITRNF